LCLADPDPTSSFVWSPDHAPFDVTALAFQRAEYSNLVIQGFSNTKRQITVATAQSGVSPPLRPSPWATLTAALGWMPLCTDGTRRISHGQDFRVGSQYWRCLGTSATLRTRASALLRDLASGTKSRRNSVRWRAAAGSSGHTPYYYCHDGAVSLIHCLTSWARMVFMPQD
jgi:hypothetical protein